MEVWLWLTLIYKRDSPDDPECLLSLSAGAGGGGVSNMYCLLLTP